MIPFKEYVMHQKQIGFHINNLVLMWWKTFKRFKTQFIISFIH